MFSMVQLDPDPYHLIQIRTRIQGNDTDPDPPHWSAEFYAHAQLDNMASILRSGLGQYLDTQVSQQSFIRMRSWTTWPPF